VERPDAERYPHDMSSPVAADRSLWSRLCWGWCRAHLVSRVRAGHLVEERLVSRAGRGVLLFQFDCDVAELRAALDLEDEGVAGLHVFE
jgi:hypothetical protein